MPPPVTSSAQLLSVYSASFKSFKLSDFRQVSVSQLVDNTLAMTTDAPVTISDLNLRVVGIHTALLEGRPHVMALSEEYGTFGDLLDANIISAPQEPTLSSLQSMLKAVYGPLSAAEPSLQLLSDHTAALPKLTQPILSTSRQGGLICKSTYMPNGNFAHGFFEGEEENSAFLGYVGHLREDNMDEWGDDAYIVRNSNLGRTAMTIPPQDVLAFASPALALKAFNMLAKPTVYPQVAAGCGLR